MPRKPRFQLPGVPQHVLQRGNNRELFRNSADETQLHQLREVLNQELVLGREDFKNRIERMTQRQVRQG